MATGLETVRAYWVWSFIGFRFSVLLLFNCLIKDNRLDDILTQWLPV